jgi:hypothetical protein
MEFSSILMTDAQRLGQTGVAALFRVLALEAIDGRACWQGF